MSRRNIILITIACVLGIFGGSFGGALLANQLAENRNKERFAQINESLSDLQSKVKSLNLDSPDNSDLKSSLTEIQDKVDKLDDIESSISKLKLDVDSIQSDVNSIESDVSSIQLKVGY